MPSREKPMMHRRGGEEGGFDPDPSKTAMGELGDYIKRMRTKRELTQKDVADALGVNHRLVSSWENGHSTVKPEHLAALAEQLGCERRELGRKVLAAYNPWVYALIFGEAAVKAKLDRIRPRPSQPSENTERTKLDNLETKIKVLNDQIAELLNPQKPGPGSKPRTPRKD